MNTLPPVYNKRIKAELIHPRGDATQTARIANVHKHVEFFNLHYGRSGAGSTKYFPISDEDLAASDHDIASFAVVFTRKEDLPKELPLVREVTNKCLVEMADIQKYIAAVGSFNNQFGIFLRDVFNQFISSDIPIRRFGKISTRLANAAFMEYSIVIRGISRFVVEWKGEKNASGNLPTRQTTNVELQTTGSTNMINTGTKRIHSGQHVYVRVLLESDASSVIRNPDKTVSVSKRPLETYQIMSKQPPQPQADVPAVNVGDEENTLKWLEYILDLYAVHSGKTRVAEARSSADSGEYFPIVLCRQ